MKRNAFFSLILFALFCWGFTLAQTKIIGIRTGIRVEEKIFMLSNRPEVTRIASLGFDGTLADLLWIRAIQYFGGNFSSLNKPEKKAGLMNLFHNMVGLDHKFVSAYNFGGFVINESMKDAGEGISFLLEGADYNPKAWRLAFDAGFISFYQLKDYETAKYLFLRSVYGISFAQKQPVLASGLVLGSSPQAMVDGNPDSETQFLAQYGSAVFDLQKPQTIGRVIINHTAKFPETMTLSKAKDIPSEYQDITSLKTDSFYIQDMNPPIQARFLKLDRFQTDDPKKTVSLSEIKVYPPANPEVPSYVERMAYEMDRAAGRFLVAWFQYQKYFEEAVRKGDRISAMLAEQKLYEIYTAKCTEILKEAVRLYQQEQNKLPSPQMSELLDQGYIDRVIAQKAAEDPKFTEEVLPVIMPNLDKKKIFSTWKGEQPHLLITFQSQDGKEDWQIVPRSLLLEQQTALIERLQKSVDKYKEDKGRLPQTLDDLRKESWFPASDGILQDPLGGEFFLNLQTGKVEARNPKY